MKNVGGTNHEQSSKFFCVYFLYNTVFSYIRNCFASCTRNWLAWPLLSIQCSFYRVPIKWSMLPPKKTLNWTYLIYTKLFSLEVQLLLSYLLSELTLYWKALSDYHFYNVLPRDPLSGIPHWSIITTKEKLHKKNLWCSQTGSTLSLTVIHHKM